MGVCPEGTPGNSPALQRRVIEYEIQMSPAGTTESRIAALRTGSFFSRPCGTWFCFPALPAVETAGYSRVSLRDRALTAFWYFRKALRLDALRRAAETLTGQTVPRLMAWPERIRPARVARTQKPPSPRAPVAVLDVKVLKLLAGWLGD